MTTLLQKTWSGIMAAGKAFQQEFLMSDENRAATYESTSARQLRYQMGWAFYESTQYNSLQSFAQGMKNQKGLYKYIQDIYNPTQRVGNFYRGVIWRGSLDAGAGNAGACPITVGETADEAKLRAAIAYLWKISNWNINKNIHVLRGTVLGDCAKYIRDDVEKKQARIELLHPSVIKSVIVDARGFVKQYEIEETRIDERGQSATYRETCEHGTGDQIIFRTYRNNSPYAWDGNNDAAGNPRAEWTEVYGFVPLVLTQHIAEGRDWGKSEIFGSLSKITTIDDEASMLHRKIRQNLDPFILANFKKPSGDLTATTSTATTDRTQPDKERQSILYVDKDNAAMTPILANLDIVGVSANIKQMLDALESDLPELADDIATANIAEGTLLAKRGRVESKVIERRINYDAGLVSAHQMAIAIGGFRGYKGFEGFDLDSYANGKLDHSISERPVFPETEDQKIEKKHKFWNVVSSTIQATQGAVSFPMLARDYGWTDEQIQGYMQLNRDMLKGMGGEEKTIDPITGEEMTQ